jgi:hypothetical protein
MEKHFLAEFVSGEKRATPRPWYNGVGDCVVYQMDIDTEIIADRIDELLTIYRSLDTGKAIGFQIKGVQALAIKFGWDAIAIKTEGVKDEIISISLAALFLSAYEDGPQTISRRQRYAEALSSCSSSAMEVPIAAMDAGKLCYA